MLTILVVDATISLYTEFVRYNDPTLRINCTQSLGRPLYRGYTECIRRLFTCRCSQTCQANTQRSRREFGYERRWRGKGRKLIWNCRFCLFFNSPSRQSACECKQQHTRPLHAALNTMRASCQRLKFGNKLYGNFGLNPALVYFVRVASAVAKLLMIILRIITTSLMRFSLKG